MAATLGVAMAAPDIRVTGAGNLISSGDTSPSTFDSTDFGAMPLGGTPIKKVFVIQNNGTDQLTLSTLQLDGASFSISIAPSTVIAASGVTSFEVTFTPTGSGLQTGTIRIPNNDPTKNPYVFGIQARATAPVARLSGNGIVIPPSNGVATTAAGTEFGNVTVNGEAFRQFTINNDGDADLVISSIGARSAASPFTVVGTPPALVTPGSSATFQVRFSPTAAQTYSLSTVSPLTSFAVNTNDPVTPTFRIPLQGTGVLPEIDITGKSILIASGSTSPSLADGTLLGDISYGTGELSSTYAIANNGSGNLLISDITLSDTTNFRMEISPAGTTQIAPGSSASLKVIFKPVVADISNTTVTIRSNDADESNFTFVVRGNALSAGMNFGGVANGDTTPDAADGTAFGNSLVGAAGATHQFTVANSGPGVLVITSLTISPSTDFTFTGQLPVTVPVGQTLNLPIVFTPASNGTHTAVVTVRTNDPSRDPFTFTVQGTGTSRTLSVGSAANPVTNGDTTPDLADGTDLGGILLGGQPLTSSFPIRNAGNIPVQISSVTSSNSAEFAIISPVTGEIAPGATVNLGIRFTPSSLGLRTSTITILSNDLSSPFVFVISGKGSPRIAEPSSPATGPVLSTGNFDSNSAGDFSGSFYETDESGAPTEVIRGGFDSFHINPTGAFTAKGNIDGLSITIKGKLAPDGTYDGLAKLTDGTTATIHIRTYKGDDNSVRIIGTLERNGQIFHIDLIRSGGVALPATLTGRYTMLIPAVDAAPQGEPHGDGIAALSVRIDGTVRSQYVLGDGTLVTRSSKISPRYVWQFHFPVYGNWKGGYLSGRVTFRDVPGVSDFDGTVYWKRTANPKATYYPGGFSIERSAIGAKYVEPVKGKASLPGLVGSLQNAEMRIGSSGEGVPAGAVPFSWSTADRITGPVGPGTSKLALNVNRKSGLVSGTYIDPVSHSRVNIYSAILQKQQLAGGLFKGYKITGFVTLVPTAASN